MSRLPIIWPWLLLAGLSLSGCASGVGHYFADVVPVLAPGQSVAVTQFFDEHTGNVTALGERWRDQIEMVLRERGMDVKARKDLGMIVDEMMTFGGGADNRTGYEGSGAGFVVGGRYAMFEEMGVPVAHLMIKVFDVANGSLVMAKAGAVDLPPDWKLLSAEIIGNAYHQHLDRMDGPVSHDLLPVEAKLDREDACYPSGASARIKVNTAADSHIYILHLLADQTVHLLYPNEHLPDQPHPTGQLEFPPPALRHVVPFTVNSAVEGKTCEQGVKVIVSRSSLAFPVTPGADGQGPRILRQANLKEAVSKIAQMQDWNEASLDYWVGPDCGRP